MKQELDVALIERLQLIFEWYKGMINERTGRLEYLYYPRSDRFSPDSSPIREIASLWDMEILSAFLGRPDLQTFISQSLHHFSGFCTKRNGFMILDSRLLREPSGIAHSAFMLLSYLHSQLPEKREKIVLLAEGIVRQQRHEDGSYKIYFGDEPDSGLEFYPGEAMLALSEAYGFTGDTRYLESIERGFQFYVSQYYERDMVEDYLLVFFVNWQSQFCLPLFRFTAKGDIRKIIKDYAFHLHDRIIEDGFYRRIRAHPDKQSLVEVACAAEGLNDAYSIAMEENDERIEQYREALCTALSYLLDLQCVDYCTQRERGGFGFSSGNRAQRVDVTGHVVNAFIKTLRNSIECH
jgi:hypothetical protein